MKTLQSIIPVVLVLCAACAATLPAELRDARQAFENARNGPAATLTPAELEKAQVALQEAETSWHEDPYGFRTLDLAYVAQRKAEIAAAKGVIAHELAVKVKAQDELIAAQARIMEQTKSELARTKANAASVAGQLSAEQQAHQDAERRATDLQAALARLAAVKQEERGLVITLSGSVLFRTDESTLLPDARTRLDEVAAALLESKDRALLVEGHTDSRGSASHNMDLSQRRADAVRDYLVGRGYPAMNITATGYGSQRPIAENKSAEGRANNRRVEIVVTPLKVPLDEMPAKSDGARNGTK